MTDTAAIIAICAVATSFWVGAWFAVATTQPVQWQKRAKDARHAIVGNLVILALGLAFLWVVR